MEKKNVLPVYFSEQSLNIKFPVLSVFHSNVLVFSVTRGVYPIPLNIFDRRFYDKIVNS